jgi:D-arabinose 1-dehydrogenase-like Zn-dependent alcohol dehydrogenase
LEESRNTRDVRFCGEHNITSDIELIDMQDINKAYDRVTSNDVKYRFVIDMKSLNKIKVFFYCFKKVSI